MIQNKDIIIENGSNKIADIIGARTEIKKSGSNYKGCCPFHKEKTPSFTVNPNKGIYKCFGCGKAGDVVDFVMEKDNYSFPQALRVIANEIGITVEEEISNSPQINTDHSNTYLRFLNECKVVESWRGFKKETLKSFQISAPITEVPKNINNADLLSAELIWENSGHIRSAKAEVIIPLHQRGKIKGIAVRNPNGSKGAKYINPSSAIYDKSRFLYGLDQARSIKSDKVILVEGYTDTMRLYESGYKAISTCGTTLSRYQAKTILSLADNVIIWRDPDKAGKRSLIADIKMFLQLGIFPDFIISKDDPDEHLLKETTLPSCIDDIEEKLRFIKEGISEFYSHADEFELLSWLIAIPENISPTTSHYKAVWLEAAQSIYSLDKKRFEELIRSIKNNLREKNRSKEVQALANKYGVWPTKEGMWLKGSEKDFKLTNFRCVPIAHIQADKNQESIRILEIINIRGDKRTLQLGSGSITSLGMFQRAVENEGYFMTYIPNATVYNSLKEYLFGEMPSAAAIDKPGYFEVAGQGGYCFSNGVLFGGKFLPKNNNNIVHIPGIKKNIFIQNDSKELAYVPGPFNSFKEFYAEYKSIELDKNPYNDIGLCFVALALHSDIVFNIFGNIPALYCSGKPGSGKSDFATILNSFFNKNRGFELTGNTNRSMVDRAIESKNSIVFYEEFKNAIDPRRIQFLKQFYNRTGYEKRGKSIDGSYSLSIKENIDSVLLVCGQESPSVDPALGQRGIHLNFTEVKAKTNQKEYLEFKRKYETSLNNLIPFILDRELFKNNFQKVYLEYNERWTNTLLKSGYDLENRALNNHLIILVSGVLLHQKTGCINIAALEQQLYESYIRQVSLNKEISETLVFFRALMSGQVDEREAGIQAGISVLTPDLSASTTWKLYDKKERKDSINYNYAPVGDEETGGILVVCLNLVYDYYQRKGSSKITLPQNDLREYLKSDPAFIGEKKAYRVGVQKLLKRVMLFDLSKIDIQFKYTDEL